MVRLGLIGKTNTGKTTFFNAATLQSAEISSYPFTTKLPNFGIAYAITPCVDKEFGVKCSPKSAPCIDDWRYLPLELIDLPGLIKGAWAGKGLGNQFLAVASQSDALLHVVDASGSVDEEGKLTEPGSGNPVADVFDIEEELVIWLMKVIERNEDRVSKSIKAGKRLAEAIAEPLHGMRISTEHVEQALKLAGLESKEFENWNMNDDMKFAKVLRDISKPTIIVANKVDLETSELFYQELVEKFPDKIVVPCSSEAELILRRAEQRGLIRYKPGEEKFVITGGSALTEQQRWALEVINERIFGRYLRTGVQFAIDVTVFKLLGMNTVYPVYDVKTLTDRSGNVLPDAFLVPADATVRELAERVHKELAKGLLYAIDARTGLRVPADHRLKDRDVIKIVSATAHG
ncbi:MAG: redox-regulated ATPase YchF [Thaumarchaeota archaeon]|nr:redox-regulated ATPase YchF [Candidatus Calditenuaceae archaeon]MDW8186445.1 redox-regulated ATPase YchF [Nitrososphaerota archaeon]